MSRRYVLLLLLAACATATSEPPGVTTQRTTTVAPNERIDLTQQNVVNTLEFAATRERVWNAVLEAHQALRSVVGTADQQNGVAKFQLESRMGSLIGKSTGLYIDCAQGPAGPRVNTHRVTVRITHTLVNDAPDRTRLLTLVDATARHPGMSADAVQCSSTGRLEAEIGGMIAARLN